MKLNRETVRQRLKSIGERGIKMMTDDELIEAYCLSGLFASHEATQGFYEEDIEGLEPERRIGTDECIRALIDWTENNLDKIPKEKMTRLLAHRAKALEKGHTRASNWSRRGIKKIGDKTYRIFDCRMCRFDYEVYFLVVEENGNLSITAGTREQFDQYFNKIGYNWGWA